MPRVSLGRELDLDRGEKKLETTYNTLQHALFMFRTTPLNDPTYT
jgi:hypothetical protein